MASIRESPRVSSAMAGVEMKMAMMKKKAFGPAALNKVKNQKPPTWACWLVS